MRHLVLTIAVAAASAGAMAADVGVSVRVGQPNFYGRIDLGELPRPQVVYAQPIIVQPAPGGVVVQPIYLRVPPGHAKHWNKHCQRYNACGQPVYFVQEGWYNNVYAPRYRVAVEPAPLLRRAPPETARNRQRGNVDARIREERRQCDVQRAAGRGAPLQLEPVDRREQAFLVLRGRLHERSGRTERDETDARVGRMLLDEGFRRRLPIARC